MRTGLQHLLRLAVVPPLLAIAWARAEPMCSAHSGAAQAPLVELYTSEGCNSCPPADQWMSRLKTDPSVVALAFHVDYWDRLGWKDRFSRAQFTQRQTQQQTTSGAGFSYTPQVIVNGRDRKDWFGLKAPIPSAGPAPVAIAIDGDGRHFGGSVTTSGGEPRHLAGYWAVTEQNHVTAVKAGENEGVTLHHDFVVRDYLPIAAWTTRAGIPTSLAFDTALPADPAHPRQIVLVVTDADTGRPLQAAKAGC